MVGHRLFNFLKLKGVNVYNLDPLLNNQSNKINLPDEVDFIFHAAAKSSIREAFEQGDNFVQHNLLATDRAIQIAKKRQATLVYFSSYVYGKPKYSPIDEKHPLQSLNPYMFSKIEGEKRCIAQKENESLKLIIIRPFSIYGKDMREGRLIGDFCRYVEQDKPLILNSPSPIRDYLHVDDFCELSLKIIKNRKTLPESPIFNVGSGYQFSNLEFAHIFKAISGSPYPIEIQDNDRKNDVFEVIPNLDKLKEFYEWEPSIDLKDGLRRVLTKPS
jgi:UDP-glucose 4-epimerase